MKKIYLSICELNQTVLPDFKVGYKVKSLHKAKTCKDLLAAIGAVSLVNQAGTPNEQIFIIIKDQYSIGIEFFIPKTEE